MLKQLILFLSIINLNCLHAQTVHSFEKIDSIVYIALISQKKVQKSSDDSYLPNRVAFRIQFPFEYNSRMTPWDFFELNGYDTIISREFNQHESAFKLIELNSELNFNKAGYRIEVFSLKNVFKIDYVQEDYLLVDSFTKGTICSEKLFVRIEEKSPSPIYTVDIPVVYTPNSLIQYEKWNWLQNHISKFN